MKNYIRKNKVSIISNALIGGMLTATALITFLFNEVTPSALLFF